MSARFQMALLGTFLLVGKPVLAEDERPPGMHWVDSKRVPLRIHWEQSLPSTRVARILELFERSWQIQVTEWNWPPPLPDGALGGDAKLDVYLLPLAPGQADTVQDRIVADPFATASCYIQLDQNLADDGTLESYVHHELNHALQFALDPYEADSFFEQTASLVERLLLPESPEATSGNADFQRHPHRALDAMATEKGDRYEYGAALFLQYLTGKYGRNKPDLAYQLWQASRQPARAKRADNNEPDWIDALPDVLKRFQAPGIEDVLLDFQAWRLQEGLAERIPIPHFVVSGGRPTHFSPAPDQAPASWGVNYLQLDTQGASSMSARLTDGGKGHWRLWAAGMTAKGQWLAPYRTELGLGEATLQIPTAGARRVYLTVLNYGAEPKDPDLRQWSGQPYTLSFGWK